MKKTLFTIAFMAVALFANAFEGRQFSVDFNKKEFRDKEHKYELVEISQIQQAGEEIVTFECVDKETNQVSFGLKFSEKGMFVKFQKCELTQK